MKLYLLSTLTMIAFAANSVFARLAMAENAIGSVEYSLVRLASGALILWLIVHLRRSSAPREGGTLLSALSLWVYVLGFSVAYLALDTGVGALIMFATVQLTMISVGIWRGQRPSLQEWFGLTIAFGAFAYFVSPGLTAPDPIGTSIMIAAGVGWGVYSLRGATSSDPLGATAGNFALGTAIMIAIAALWFTFEFIWEADGKTPTAIVGLIYATASGAITSGLGYALWYHCLRQLTVTKASIIQLSVPAIAAIGGVAFAGETLTMRTIVCASLILGGVALAIVARTKKVA